MEVKLHAMNDQYWVNTKPWITTPVGTFRWQVVCYIGAQNSILFL